MTSTAESDAQRRGPTDDPWQNKAPPPEAGSAWYRIETKRVLFGRWIYIIHLAEHKSLPSRRFPTQEAALQEAYEMLCGQARMRSVPRLDLLRALDCMSSVPIPSRAKKSIYKCRTAEFH